MKEILGKIVLLIFFLTLVGLVVKGFLYKKEIDENRKVTVCQFVRCKSYPKTTASYFEYYVDGKLYREEYGECPENSAEKIGKYYIIKYSSLDPRKIIVDFAKEEKDTAKIIDAGFTLKN